jgi:glyoxylase-like metal-dependent hydrolase (beta-lactamase superfamily II)
VGSDRFGGLAPGVFWVEQSVLEGKNGVVVGTRGALAIDSGNSDADGQTVAGLIRVQDREPNRLALTHGHGDHVIGSSAFRGAEVYAHARTAAVTRRHLPNLARLHDRPRLAAELTWPTVTFTDELQIDLGGKTVRLFSTPGHSEDGVCAYVVEERILFSGDTAVTAITPVAADGNSRQLEASLRRLANLGAEVLVPGHGPVLHGQAHVRGWLVWAAEYLTGVRSRAHERLARGDQPDAVIDACSYEEFVGDRLRHQPKRPEKPHQLTVRKIVAEAQAELGM